MRMLILFLSLGLLLYGDVMYEKQITTEGMMGMSIEQVIREYIKSDRSRTESTTSNKMTGETNSITITRLDKKVIWTLDINKKQYSETKLGEMPKSENETGEKIEIPKITIEKTGKKKEILGKECEQIIVSMDIKEDEGKCTFIQTMWVTKDVPGYEETTQFNEELTKLNFDQSSPPIPGFNKKSYDEFLNKTDEIEGFPLEFEMNITMGSEGISFSTKSHCTVTKIETNPINQNVFEIPKGYVLVEK